MLPRYHARDVASRGGSPRLRRDRPGCPAAPAAAIGFGPPHRISPPNAWNPGKSLAATPNRLLSIWASDCPPPKGQCATDHGPRMGVFVRRSPANADPPRWGAAFRLSPRSVQAERPSIDADGVTVVASYVTQRSYQRYRPGAPRVLWIRVSTTQGRTWRSPVRLSPPDGRVDYPRVAVAGSRIVAVWTAAGTGAIRFARSDDLGAHWMTVTVATTTATPMGAGEGFRGSPMSARAARTSRSRGSRPTTASSGRSSRQHGRRRLPDGQTPAQLTLSSPTDAQHYPAVGGAADPGDPRVAIAYSTDTGIDLRVLDGGSLGAASNVVTWPATSAVLLRGRLRPGGPAVRPRADRRRAGRMPPRHARVRRADPVARGSRNRRGVRATPDGGATWETAGELSERHDRPYRTTTSRRSP